MEWTLAHVGDILSIVAYIVAAAAAIAALTPTTADDSAVAWVRKLIDILALNIGNAKNK